MNSRTYLAAILVLVLFQSAASAAIVEEIVKVPVSSGWVELRFVRTTGAVICQNCKNQFKIFVAEHGGFPMVEGTIDLGLILGADGISNCKCIGGYGIQLNMCGSPGDPDERQKLDQQEQLLTKLEELNESNPVLKNFSPMTIAVIGRVLGERIQGVPDASPQMVQRIRQRVENLPQAFREMFYKIERELEKNGLSSSIATVIAMIILAMALPVAA